MRSCHTYRYCQYWNLSWYRTNKKSPFSLQLVTSYHHHHRVEKASRGPQIQIGNTIVIIHCTLHEVLAWPDSFWKIGYFGLACTLSVSAMIITFSLCGSDLVLNSCLGIAFKSSSLFLFLFSEKINRMLKGALPLWRQNRGN